MKMFLSLLIASSILTQPLMAHEPVESKLLLEEVNQLKQKIDKLSKQLKDIQTENKANHKEVLMYAKQPREQHTHYGFLSPAPGTVALGLGIPALAAITITLILKNN